jgi:hypothetical protein
VAVTIMTGFVRKKALGRDKMDWKLRYLVLTGNLLKYYESFVDLDSTKAPKGTLKLRKESTVKAPAYFHPHEVEVTVKPGKVLYFYTEDKVEQEQWLTAIGAAIHALQPQPEKGWCCWARRCVFFSDVACRFPGPDPTALPFGMTHYLEDEMAAERAAAASVKVIREQHRRCGLDDYVLDFCSSVSVERSFRLQR